jgi:Cu2+-exporting ATPase
MHPEVSSEKPGKCPKCGMKLVEESEGGGGEHQMSGDHNHHDHASMMASPEAAGDFLWRFFVVTALLVPLALFSEPAVKFLGMPDFELRRWLELGVATGIFYFGLVFFRHARMEIQMRQYGMMTLVSLGVGAGYLFSAASTFIPAVSTEFYLEISTLIWVLLFGHFLEAKSSTAAGDALQEVAKLLPKEAHRIEKIKGQRSKIKDIDISLLKEGDVVLVKPGEKVPADGVIVKGGGNFNEAHITGESKPVEKKVESEVVAGSISIDGSVEVKLSRVGESSTIGQIQSLIASAKQTKPSAQKLADRAARWLTFSALSVSVVTLLFWSLLASQPLVTAATLAITVLVIACPHALGLAIPTVSTIATKLAVANGVFIKDMGKIEIVKGATYVVFDKTGTLTKGEFGVTDVIQIKDRMSKIKNINERSKIKSDSMGVMQIAAALEGQSSHVIGLAIVKYAKEKGVKDRKVSGFKNLAGRGLEGVVSGSKYWVGNQRLMKERGVWGKSAEELGSKLASEGKTPVFVANEDKVLGVIGLSDRVKEESVQAVSQLHSLGVKVAMLTGDTRAAAEPVAKELGIDTVFAEVLPEDKYRYVKELQDKGSVVVMAGDGVNDAPALTQANVGVAIGAGTDVAVEAGDIVLTQSNPQHIVRLIVLARKVYRKMVENLVWAAGYNVVAIPAAAGLFIPLGFRLTPAVGALLMSLSSVIVVTNALTLRRVKLQI